MKQAVFFILTLIAVPMAFSLELNAHNRVMNVLCGDKGGHRDLDEARIQLVWNPQLVSATLNSKVEPVNQATNTYTITYNPEMGYDFSITPEIVNTTRLLSGYYNQSATEVRITSIGNARIYSLWWGGDRAGSVRVVYQLNKPTTADVYFSINGVLEPIPMQTCALEFK